MLYAIKMAKIFGAGFRAIAPQLDLVFKNMNVEFSDAALIHDDRKRRSTTAHAIINVFYEKDIYADDDDFDVYMYKAWIERMVAVSTHRAAHEAGEDLVTLDTLPEVHAECEVKYLVPFDEDNYTQQILDHDHDDDHYDDHYDDNDDNDDDHYDEHDDDHDDDNDDDHYDDADNDDNDHDHNEDHDDHDSDSDVTYIPYYEEGKYLKRINANAVFDIPTRKLFTLDLVNQDSPRYYKESAKLRNLFIHAMLNVDVSLKYDSIAVDFYDRNNMHTDHHRKRRAINYAWATISVHFSKVVSHDEYVDKDLYKSWIETQVYTAARKAIAGASVALVRKTHIPTVDAYIDTEAIPVDEHGDHPHIHHDDADEDHHHHNRPSGHDGYGQTDVPQPPHPHGNTPPHMPPHPHGSGGPPGWMEQGYDKPGYGQAGNGYGQGGHGYGQGIPGYGQGGPGYGPGGTGYGQGGHGYGQAAPGYGQDTPGYGQDGTGYGQGGPGYGQSGPGYGHGGPGYEQGGTGYTQGGPGNGQGGHGYGQGVPGYGQGTPGYGPGGTGYGQGGPDMGGQTAPGYGQGTPGYGQGSVGYEEDAPVYGQGSPGYGNGAGNSQGHEGHGYGHGGYGSGYEMGQQEGHVGSDSGNHDLYGKSYGDNMYSGSSYDPGYGDNYGKGYGKGKYGKGKYGKPPGRWNDAGEWIENWQEPEKTVTHGTHPHREDGVDNFRVTHHHHAAPSGTEHKHDDIHDNVVGYDAIMDQMHHNLISHLHKPEKPHGSDNLPVQWEDGGESPPKDHYHADNHDAEKHGSHNWQDLSYGVSDHGPHVHTGDKDDDGKYDVDDHDDDHHDDDHDTVHGEHHHHEKDEPECTL